METLQHFIKASLFIVLQWYAHKEDGWKTEIDNTRRHNLTDFSLVDSISFHSIVSALEHRRSLFFSYEMSPGQPSLYWYSSGSNRAMNNKKYEIKLDTE